MVVKLTCYKKDRTPMNAKSSDSNAWKTLWLLGDALLHPTFPLIMLCHLCTSLLIIASSRWSALAALIVESNGHMT